MLVGQAALFDQACVVSPDEPESRIEVSFGALAVAVEICDDFVEKPTFVPAVTGPEVKGLSKVHWAACVLATHGGLVTDPTVRVALAVFMVSVIATNRCAEVFG